MIVIFLIGLRNPRMIQRKGKTPTIQTTARIYPTDTIHPNQMMTIHPTLTIFHQTMEATDLTLMTIEVIDDHNK